MPKRIIIDTDYVFQGVIYEAGRDANGRSVATVVDVPEGWPAHLGRPAPEAPVTSSYGAVEPVAPSHPDDPSTVADPRAEGVQLADIDEETRPKSTARSVDYESLKRDQLLEMAQARNIEPTGTGAQGRITREDLITALQAADNA